MSHTAMMMDGMGMMALGVLSMVLGLVVLFLFILAAAYAVKWVWGSKTAEHRGAPRKRVGYNQKALRQRRNQ